MKGSWCGLCRCWNQKEDTRIVIELKRPGNLIAQTLSMAVSAIGSLPIPGFVDPWTITIAVPNDQSDELLNAMFEGSRDYVYKPPEFIMPKKPDEPHKPLSDNAPIFTAMKR